MNSNLTTVKFTRLQLRMVKEWLKVGRQADLDAYSESLEPYGISEDHCKKQWIEIWKQLKRKRG